MRTKHKCPTEVASGEDGKIKRFWVGDFSFHYKFFYFSLLLILIYMCVLVSTENIYHSRYLKQE